MDAGRSDAGPRMAAEEMVRRRPGATVTDIARGLGCSLPTAAYHLQILQRDGRVVSRRDGRARRHFIAEHASDPERFAQCLLRDPRRMQILAALARTRDREMTVNQIARASGASFAACKSLLGLLERNAYVSVERRQGRHAVRKLPLFETLAMQPGVQARPPAPANDLLNDGPTLASALAWHRIP